MMAKSDFNHEKIKFIERNLGETKICYSRGTSVDDDNDTMHDNQKFWTESTVQGFRRIVYRLPLKVVAVIILKKIDIDNDHCNVTRYLITNLTKTWFKRKSHMWQESKLLIPWILIILDSFSFPVPFKRTQFLVLITLLIFTQKYLRFWRDGRSKQRNDEARVLNKKWSFTDRNPSWMIVPLTNKPFRASFVVSSFVVLPFRRLAIETEERVNFIFLNLKRARRWSRQSPRSP